MLSEDQLQKMLDGMAAAYSTGDAAACAALFSDDAQLHSPFAPPAIGRNAIEELHAEWTAEKTAKSFHILDWGSAEGTAWCLCRFSEGDDTASDGTSLLALEKHQSGDWLIRACCLYGDA